MAIDLSSFQKALVSFKRAIDRSQGAPLDEELRDAVIQRFEYTYELSWKMLKRQLEAESPTPSTIDTLSFKELIREGAERRFLKAPESWFEYREQRNITSHTYDAAKAASVYRTALVFFYDAEELLQKLESRQA